MIYKISKPEKNLKGTIQIPFSKSESNRLLIIQALCKDSFKIKNLSDSEDTLSLQKILTNDAAYHSTSLITPITHDVGDAGTTMRFLTAFFALKQGTRILTGSDRMKKRPIQILVDGLKSLGAKIEYLENEGYPPLKIEGTNLEGGEVTINSSVSSQYVSALLLIAPQLPKGLKINLSEKITSRPYIQMTLKIMEKFGVDFVLEDHKIQFLPKEFKAPSADFEYEVDADWSSASYWFEMAAMAKDVELKLVGLKRNSLQGDSVISDLFVLFGVKAEFVEDGVLLTKYRKKIYEFVFDFTDCPDLAQTLAVVVSALKIPTLLNGLQTLKIKETNRTLALCNELDKIGVKAVQGTDSLEIPISYIFHSPTTPIATYKDHRMAMAFAPLALMFNDVSIENPEVVKKSYPNFWNDMKSIGFEIKEV